jgi:hypothetical protein
VTPLRGGSFSVASGEDPEAALADFVAAYSALSGIAGGLVARVEIIDADGERVRVSIDEWTGDRWIEDLENAQDDMTEWSPRWAGTFRRVREVSYLETGKRKRVKLRGRKGYYYERVREERVTYRTVRTRHTYTVWTIFGFEEDPSPSAAKKRKR